jgi:hypothetical protein
LRTGDLVYVAGQLAPDANGIAAWTAAAVPGLWMEGYLHEIAATAIVS